MLPLLLLLMLVVPQFADSPAPPAGLTTGTCAAALQAACPRDPGGTTAWTAAGGVLRCDVCASEHQQSLRASDCSAADVQSWCAAPGLPRLIFEIGEGFTNSLVASTKVETEGGDYRVLDAQLDNIHLALAPLTRSYTVDVLLYPCHLYNATAPGAVADPMQRLHPGLRRMMAYFEAADPPLGVFIEAYSSGVMTQQRDSRGGTLPATPLYNATSTPKYVGLSIDVQTAAAMKQAFPRSMRGVRFHEVYGCDSVWRSGGQKDCFQLAPEVFRAFIDVCADNGMILYHNDQSWLLKHSLQGPGQWSFHPASPAYYKTKLLSLDGQNDSTTIEYAHRRLGKRALLSFETNNGFPPADFPFLESVVDTSNRSFPVPSWEDWDWRPSGLKHFQDLVQSGSSSGNRTADGSPGWGISNQPWAWQEWVHTLTTLPGVSHGEMMCPVELLQQFAVHAIEARADVLHFEPSWYFFNEYFPNSNLSADLEEVPAAGTLPNHMERIALTRLKAVLLAKAQAVTRQQLVPSTSSLGWEREESPVGVPMPSPDLGTMFDRDQQLFMSNRASHPPLNYRQSQLLVFDRGSRRMESSFDFYSDNRTWQQLPANSIFPRSIWQTDGEGGAMGIELTGDAVSEVAKIHANLTHLIFDFYFPWGGYIAPLAIPLVDADGCELLYGKHARYGAPISAVASGNFLSQRVLGSQGDPDEIVLARTCHGPTAVSFKPELWKMTAWAWLGERSPSKTLLIEWAREDDPLVAAPVLAHLFGNITTASQQAVYPTVGIIGRHVLNSGQISVPHALRPTADMVRLQVVPCTADSVVRGAGDCLELAVPARGVHTQLALSPYTAASASGGRWLVGGAAVDVDLDGSSEIVLLNAQTHTFDVFRVTKAGIVASGAHLSSSSRLACISQKQCVLASRRILIPTIGSDPPPPPGPPHAPCNTTGDECGTVIGASGAWLATSIETSACACRCACVAQVLCKAWQFEIVGEQKGYCWLKSSTEMSPSSTCRSGIVHRDSAVYMFAVKTDDG
jgi:hypothetical protein